MDSDGDDWSSLLNAHPIFSSSTDTSLSQQFELSNDSPLPAGRRQVMVLKDADLIVAVGKELRMTSLGDAKLGRGKSKSYKVLHTPNIQFDISQVSLNPTRKLLAVAGTSQVAVVVLPRPGFMRLVPIIIDCKSIQVGQYFHASSGSAPIAKVEWHPWGEAGSTLMVMTEDGKLREYDISVDAEEPLQVISFVPDRRRSSKTFNAIDSAEREVASFTLGKGMADWGPLTIYAVMKNGDVYAVCPYMPKNASIPSSYIHALECFVAAKQEYLSQNPSSESQSLSTTYSYQHKYISALIKQLPPGTVFPAASRSIPLHPPTTMKTPPLRQGPFLLQPAPLTLDGSEDGDATDILYLSFDNDDETDDNGETERLGVVLVVTQDGKVDVCLDVDKVEARWETRQSPNAELPMLAVYETIDLGLIEALSTTHPPSLNLIPGNYPAFLPDPIHGDTVYVYHGFGVHAIHLYKVLRALGDALHSISSGAENALLAAFRSPASAEVQSIVTTFSVERRASHPVISVIVPNDVYLNYSIYVLTSSKRVVSFSLNMRSGLPSKDDPKSSVPVDRLLEPAESPAAYISLLGTEAWKPPTSLSSGLPATPRLATPGSKDFRVTPDTLRFFSSKVDEIVTSIHGVESAYRQVDARIDLQHEELDRQVTKVNEIRVLLGELRGARQDRIDARTHAIQAGQQALIARLDRVLAELMKRANPTLSDHETKWFDELGRVREQVLGAGRYDEASLRARVQALKREYDRLLPHLKVLSEKELASAKSMQEKNLGLGVSQAFEFGQQFNKERTKLEKLQTDVLELASKLDLSLSRPPTLQGS
jgi:nucleoporin NUP82